MQIYGCRMNYIFEIICNVSYVTTLFHLCLEYVTSNLIEESGLLTWKGNVWLSIFLSSLHCLGDSLQHLVNAADQYQALGFLYDCVYNNINVI